MNSQRGSLPTALVDLQSTVTMSSVLTLEVIALFLSFQLNKIRQTEKYSDYKHLA